MHQSKLFTLLRSIPPNEIHWFQKFLQSPFYNTHDLPLVLFRYISKYYPELDDPKLSKAHAFKKVFPKQEFDVQKMRKAMHQLAVLVEEFLVAMHIRKKEFQKRKLLVAELGERNVYPLFEKETKGMIKALEGLPYRDVDTYMELYQLHLEFYDHPGTARQKKNTPILKSANSFFNYYYLLQSQRLEYGLRSEAKLFRNEPSIHILEQAVEELNEMPLYKIYNLINLALTNTENEEVYSKIEKLLKAHSQQLSLKSQKEILQIILNYFGRQLNLGDLAYQAKTLNLYKFGLGQKLLMAQGQIGQGAFSNIVTLGLLEQEFDWVEQFIEAYRVFLPKSLRQDTTSLSLALLHFYKKDYESVLGILLNHNFQKPLFTLNAKTILLRTYFEQFIQEPSYFDLLIDQSFAFERFVRRNNFIAANKKLPFLNFILLTRKLANKLLEEGNDEALFHQIQNNKAVVLKSWLMEKAELLVK